MRTEPASLTLPASVEDVAWRGENAPLMISVSGEIDEEGADKFDAHFEEALRTGQTVVPIVINSTGGSLYDAMRIVDTIRSSPVRVVTSVRGTAMSAAALIFSCGVQRVIAPNACIMLHGVSSGALTEHIHDLETDAAECRRMQNLLCSIMAENCGKHADHFRTRIESRNVDVYMSPDEAVESGLATCVGYVRFKAELSLTTAVETRLRGETWRDTDSDGGDATVRGGKRRR